LRKKEWKKELRQVFEPPAPMRKKEFIGGLERPGIGFCGFLMIQAGYIRKRVWIVSALAFFTSLAGAAVFSADMLWWVSAWMPLLALTIVAESGRSENYGNGNGDPFFVKKRSSGQIGDSRRGKSAALVSAPTRRALQ